MELISQNTELNTYSDSILESNDTSFTYEIIAVETDFQNLEIESKITTLCEFCTRNDDHSMDIVEENIDRLYYQCWFNLCMNSCDRAVDIIIRNLSKVLYLNGIKYNDGVNVLNDDGTITTEHNGLKWTGHLNNQLLYALCMNINSRILNIVEERIYSIPYPCWGYLCENPSDKALDILTYLITHPKFGMDCWMKLAKNTNSRKNKLFMMNYHTWIHLCKDSSDEVFEIIEQIEKTKPFKCNKCSYIYKCNKHEKMTDEQIQLYWINYFKTLINELVENINPKYESILIKYYNYLTEDNKEKFKVKLKEQNNINLEQIEDAINLVN